MDYGLRHPILARMTQANDTNAPMSVRQQAELLSGSVEGWPLAPVVHWLMTEGIKTNDAGILIAGLSEALLAAGAPVWRVRFSFWTIHPLLAAMAHQWVRGKGTETFQVGHGIFESAAYIGSPAEQLRETGKPLRYRLMDGLDPDRDHSVLFEIREQGGTDYYAIPMQTFSGQVDSFFVTTDHPDGFVESDFPKFDALARYLLPVIETISHHRLSVALLDTYVGERTGRRVLEGKIRRGDGEEIDAALWFSDLRNFTHMTETLDPPEMLAVLNTYFEFVYNAVRTYDGEVLRFIGDAMLIVFPTDRTGGARQACRHALSAAEDAFSGLATMNHLRRRHGQPEILFGVGLHVGTVIYGNVGAPSRLDFTVMGPAVNRTARLESLTKQTRTPLLVSDRFAAHLDRPCRHVGAFDVKGIVHPIDAYAVD